MGTRKKNNANGGKRGVAAFAPTQEMIDTAKYLIGRRQYPSKVAVHIKAKYKLTNELAYRVMDAAREQALKSLAGEGHDPLAGMLLFLESVVADGTQPMKDRIASVANMIRMLGLERLIKKMDGGNVESFLARIVAAQRTTPILEESK